MKTLILLSISFLSFTLFSCGQHSDAEQSNQKADSLSIKLNSPELKAVNAELIKDASNAELYNKRAKIYLSLKEFPEAKNDSKRAIKIDSTQAPFYLTLADIYFSENNTREAKELLEATAKKISR